MRIMVIETNPEACSVIIEMLRKPKKKDEGSPHTIMAVTSMEDAIQILNNIDDSKTEPPLDVITVNSTCAPKVLKEKKDRDYNTPIVLISGVFIEGDTLPPGIAAGLAKPFQREQLLATIQQVVNN